jgi:ACS family hexuronate transporter-like MFS transporter
LLLSALVPHPLLATGAFFAAMIVAAGFIIVSLSYATHAFGTVHAGYLAGLGAGSWSAVVMVVMPLFGQLVDARAFPAAFVIAAIFPAIGVAAWARLAPHPPTLTVS